MSTTRIQVKFPLTFPLIAESEATKHKRTSVGKLLSEDKQRLTKVREKQRWGTHNQPSLTMWTHSDALFYDSRSAAACWREKRGQLICDTLTAGVCGREGKMRFTQLLLKSGSVAGIPKQVERFSKFSPSPLSMKQFLDFGKCYDLCWFCTDTAWYRFSHTHIGSCTTHLFVCPDSWLCRIQVTDRQMQQVPEKEKKNTPEMLVERVSQICYCVLFCTWKLKWPVVSLL